MNQDRQLVLLRAAYDLLTRAEDAPYVEDVTELMVHYDEVDCDGMCLREDLAYALGIDPSTPPIPCDGE